MPENFTPGGEVPIDPPRATSVPRLEQAEAEIDGGKESSADRSPADDLLLTAGIGTRKSREGRHPHSYTGADVRAIRAMTGLTPAAFAILLDVPTSTVELWELEQGLPDERAALILETIELFPSAIRSAMDLLRNEDGPDSAPYSAETA
jgi:DNA-binding transcriptional regulator YiaG